MRVLFVSPWARLAGGAEIILWNILNHLDRSRVEPSLAFLEHGPFAEDVRALAMRTDVVPAGRLRHAGRMLAATRSLARVIDEQRPDLIVSWSAKAHVYGASARLVSRARPPAIWWQQMAPEGHWIDRLATALPADAVGAWSHIAAHRQRQLWPQRRTFVVHPGVADPGEPSPAARLAARARLGIPPQRRVLLIVGRLQPWKGQDRFIEAVARLRRLGLDVHGVIVGGAAFGLSTDFASSLAPLAERLAIADRVLFAGQVDDVTSYLRCADVLVNASDLEPFGNVLIEAMAHAVPVLAVAGGGPSEILVDGVSGVLVGSPDSEQLAPGLAGLIGDETYRRRLGRAGRERFLEAFTAQRMADRLATELEEVLAQPSEAAGAHHM